MFGDTYNKARLSFLPLLIISPPRLFEDCHNGLAVVAERREEVGWYAYSMLIVGVDVCQQHQRAPLASRLMLVQVSSELNSLTVTPLRR